MTSKISVVINTLNEENNLPNALKSVMTWADEIIVVDMYSEDRTVEIAKKYGARVYYHERVGFVEPARNYAIKQAKYEWILILDADEMVPFELSKRLQEIAFKDEADVVALPWLNFLLGAPIMHTSWGPEQDNHKRFFKKNKFIVPDQIHGILKPVTVARLLKLSYSSGMAVVHFNYLDSSHFIEKLNRYTTIEATQAFESNNHSSFIVMLKSTLKEFLIRYLKHQGYRDSWRGFYLSIYMMFYRVVVQAKLKELEEVGDRTSIQQLYDAEAEIILEGYNSRG